MLSNTCRGNGIFIPHYESDAHVNGNVQHKLYFYCTKDHSAIIINKKLRASLEIGSILLFSLGRKTQRRCSGRRLLAGNQAEPLLLLPEAAPEAAPGHGLAAAFILYYFAARREYELRREVDKNT